MTERRGYQTVFDDSRMAILVAPGTSDDCLVSFTGVGHSMGGIDLQNPEFSRSGGDETTVFVIDKARSWGNNVDWEVLDGVMDEWARGLRVTTLGNSMGGFLAILASERLNAHRTIAFVPQWSMSPDVVPWENRWPRYQRHIRQFRFPDLSQAFHAPTRYSVFFGSDPLDDMHRAFFPKDLSNLDLFVLEDGGHNVARYLKEEDMLYPVITACRSGGDVEQVLGQAGIRCRRC